MTRNKYDINFSLENAITYLNLNTTTPKESEILLSITRIALLEESLKFYQDMIQDIQSKIDTEKKRAIELKKDYPGI